MKHLTAIALSVLCGLLGPAHAAAPGAAAAGWQPTGLAGGGAMFAISASPHDPNLLMLSSDMSGAYLSRDGGRSWQLLHFRQLAGNTGCPALFHPEKPDVIYAPADAGANLKVSTDRGKTWQEFVTKSPWQGALRGLCLPDGETFFVGTDKGLWRSTDGGRKWQPCVGVTGAWLGLCADRRAKNRLLAGTGDGIFRSDDNGASFRPVGQGLPKLAVRSFAGSSDGKRTMLYVALECRLEDGKLVGGMYGSTDGGDTWARVMNPELNVETKRSSEWANGDLPQYSYVLTTDKQPQRVYVYCAGTSYHPPNHSTVYRSDDAGRSWKAVFFSDPRFKGVYNVEDDRLTLGIGQRWQEVPHSMGINPGNPDEVLMTTSMFVFVTRDGGKSWQVCQDNHPQSFGKQKAWPCNGLVVTSTWNFYRDPFDRLLVAQAITEPARLLTVDSALGLYSELVDVL